MPPCSPLCPVFVPAHQCRCRDRQADDVEHNKIVNGDYVMVGNGVLQCDSSKPIFPGSNFTCLQLHNATAQANLVNDFAKWMGNVDADSNAATVNSSRATVTIPSGAKVVKAVLYLEREHRGPQTHRWEVCLRPTSAVSTPAPDGRAPVTPAGSPSTQPVTVNFGASTFTAAPTNYSFEAPAQLANGNPQYYTAQS